MGGTEGAEEFRELPEVPKLPKIAERDSRILGKTYHGLNTDEE
jgi:hypothetical protein